MLCYTPLRDQVSKWFVGRDRTIMDDARGVRFSFPIHSGKALSLLVEKAGKAEAAALWSLAHFFKDKDAAFAKKAFQKVLSVDPALDVTEGFRVMTREGTSKAEVEEGIQFLEDQIRSGSDRAAMMLANFYHKGHKYFPADRKKTEIIWESVVAKDNKVDLLYPGEANYNLGIVYREDQTKSFDYFLEAARRGYQPAFVRVGVLYHHLFQDNAKAIEWLKKSPQLEESLPRLATLLGTEGRWGEAEKIYRMIWKRPRNGDLFLGEVMALRHLAGHLFEGRNMKKDLDTSLELLTLLWEKYRDMQAGVDLCNRYRLEGYAKRDIGKAKDIALDMIRAKFPEGHHIMGCMYRLGDFGSTNWDEAEKHFLLSLKTANSFLLGRSYGFLGDIYERGPKKNLFLAFTSYLKAAEQGDLDSVQCVMRCYEIGVGVEVDLEQARLWQEAMIRLSIELVESRESDGAAERAMAEGYFKGIVFEIDPVKGVEWLLKGAECGDAIALHDLSKLYRAGKFVTQDIAKADQLLEKAAKLGHGMASEEYAALLFDKNPPDPVGAFQAILIAANIGSLSAHIKVAECHYKGLGTKTDLKSAEEWIRRAIRTYGKDKVFQAVQFALVDTEKFHQFFVSILVKEGQQGAFMLNAIWNPAPDMIKHFMAWKLCSACHFYVKGAVLLGEAKEKYPREFYGAALAHFKGWRGGMTNYLFKELAPYLLP